MGYKIKGDRVTLSNGDVYTPNRYQFDVIHHVLEQSGDIVVNAVAGSGKSTTLKILAGIIDTGIQLAAFNRSIKDELSHKLRDFRNVSVTTIHGAGFAGVRNAWPGVKVSNGIYRKRAIAELKREGNDFPYVHAGHTATLWDRVRVGLIDPFDDEGSIVALVRELDLELSSDEYRWSLAWIRRAYQRMISAPTITEIDFTDMIWLCAMKDECRPRESSWVLVDECQDLSPAQLAVMLRVRMTGGRMVFVGDRNQAIYGFAGASTRSIDIIVSKTGAKELPLSVCYRCPASHLRLAREIVPQIEEAPGAIEGVVNSVDRGKLADGLEDGDIILCRLTAPLVSVCFELIRHGIAARVRGRDIGKSLAKMVRDVAKKNRRSHSAGFLDALSEYRDRLVRKYLAETDNDEDDPRLITVMDKSEAILTLFDPDDLTEADLCRRIEDLFADERVSVWLSTVHRAKGLEADRVYILKPSRIRLSLRDQDARQQEANLEYVALTRSKHTLTFITDGGPDEDKAARYIMMAHGDGAEDAARDA